MSSIPLFLSTLVVIRLTMFNIQLSIMYNLLCFMLLVPCSEQMNDETKCILVGVGGGWSPLPHELHWNPHKLPHTQRMDEEGEEKKEEEEEKKREKWRRKKIFSHSFLPFLDLSLDKSVSCTDSYIVVSCIFICVFSSLCSIFFSRFYESQATTTSVKFRIPKQQ